MRSSYYLTSVRLQVFCSARAEVCTAVSTDETSCIFYGLTIVIIHS